VDELERNWSNGQLIRLDILSEPAREFGRAHGFEFTPTFILFDGDGNELRRWVGRPPMLEELPQE
jgi:hypothetical protein